ncbi:hypothetical protein BDA99DRAFT_529887 [Phascolomyces articulosus]|uniref:DUF8032 domain-containing protein n=1 Tax=Phascolomyces articulosus TaxID=60185 RepID=A0AAD5JLE7_9FUNG|nr:hypothetical protein BDA99DRAFT_529887 [Phascolomyces articulosus]
MTTTSILSLHDLIHATEKAEHVLEDLSSEQITLIEQTIRRIKKRKLNCQKEEDEYLPTSTFSSSSSSSSSSTTSRRTLARTTTTPSSSSSSRNTSRHEPTVEIRDGVEWVSFVYSHNRVLKRYSIRTDIQTVTLDTLDEQFKLDNCVYPRAHLPKETYRGNRWNYETECNRLGWKLAWLNKSEIAGKRGLIQRAVDSYRNRSPSMRSRRVARQAKLLNGTLRKRKHQSTSSMTEESKEDRMMDIEHQQQQQQQQYEEEEEEMMATSFPTTLAAATVKSAHSPKTLIMTDDTNDGRYRIKINVENVSLNAIPDEFRKTNCVFPRAMTTTETHYSDKRRWIEESMCNELGWKLAWLNQRYLAGKKNLLQRAIDIYRVKFMPALQPRKSSVCSSSSSSSTSSMNTAAPHMPPIVMDTSNPSSPSSCSSTAESSFDEDLMMLPAQFLAGTTTTTSVPDFTSCFDNMMFNMATTTSVVEPSFVSPSTTTTFPACIQIPSATTVNDLPFSLTHIIPTSTATTCTMESSSEDDNWLKFEQDDFNDSTFLSYDALF